MNFTLSDEVKLMMESVRDWYSQNLPLEKVKEVDQKGHPMPKDVMEGLAGLGVIMGVIPEEQGGQGLDWFTQAAIAEEIGYGDPTAACAVWNCQTALRVRSTWPQATQHLRHRSWAWDKCLTPR